MSRQLALNLAVASLFCASAASAQTVTLTSPFVEVYSPVYASYAAYSRCSPVVMTYSPVVATYSPVVVRYSPMVTYSPVVTTYSPVTTTYSPIVTTRSLVLTTYSPVVTVQAPAEKRKATQAPLPVPVVDAGSLMRLFNKPLYTNLKKAVAQRPAGLEDWANIQERGLQAAEVANLVAIRQAKPPEEQWLQGALNLQQAGLTLAKAAEAKDWDATTRAYSGLIQQCNNCHQVRAPGKAPMLKP